MRAGETDKAVSFKDQKLFDLIEKFVRDIGSVFIKYPKYNKFYFTIFKISGWTE